MCSFFGNASLLWAQHDFLARDLTFAFMSFLVHVYKKARKFIVVVFQFKKILRSHDFKSVVTAKNGRVKEFRACIKGFSYKPVN